MIPHENDPVAPQADDVERHTADPDQHSDAQNEILLALFEEAYYFNGGDAESFLVEWRARVSAQLGYPCHMCGPMCVCPDAEASK
jgi:hypothetical protein